MVKKKSTKGSRNQHHSFLLDQFSNVDLINWKKLSDSVQEYEVRAYYELEAQRTLHYDALTQSLNNSQCISPYRKSSLTRIVDYKYSLSPLSVKGSMIMGGRFNIGEKSEDLGLKAFPVLYMADGFETAYSERFGNRSNGLEAHELSLTKPSSFTSVNVSVNLDTVFDLTKPKNLKEFVRLISQFTVSSDLVNLGIKIGHKGKIMIADPIDLQRSLIEENWRHRPSQFAIPANSQIFGKILKDAGFQGILFPSSKLSRKECLGVFVENIEGTDSYVKIENMPPEGVESELNSKNWRNFTI